MESDHQNRQNKDENKGLTHRTTAQTMAFRARKIIQTKVPRYFGMLGRMRRKSGIEDVLPAEPPKHVVTIPGIEMPAHAVRDSLLHSKSGYTNYRGLFNLALLGLFVTGGRVASENINKYGILVNPLALVQGLAVPGSFTCLLLFLCLNIFLLLSLATEVVASRSRTNSRMFAVVHRLIVLATILLPTVVIVTQLPPPLLSFFVMFEASIYCLKIWSYVMVNEHYRSAYKTAVYRHKVESDHSDSNSSQQLVASPKHIRGNDDNEHHEDDDEDSGEDHIAYPENLTVSNISYFILAPTLCYELNFPRNNRIRYRFLLRRIAEVVFFLLVIASLFQQWVLPTVVNTFQSHQPDEIDVWFLLDRTFKLSVPNNIIWLCLFYMYFHSMLNVIGELMRFGDRQFYRDWWNATSITYFWKNWNIPVHKWMIRHVYRPLRHAGWSKSHALILVFFISAAFHELLVSVPLGLFRMWAFLGMAMQVPLALISDKYLEGSQYGNVVVWASLFFGQPVAIMLYVQAYLASSQD